MSIKPRKPRKPKTVPVPGPPSVDGLEWATDDDVEDLPWLWPGIIPGGAVTLLEGRKGTGKSTILAAIAAAVTGGRDLPGWSVREARPVIWSGGEEGWRTMIVPRLRAVGAQHRWVSRARLKRTDGSMRPLILPEDIWDLERQIRAAGVALVVLDPFASCCSATLDLRVEQQARAYLEPIGQIAESTGAAFILSRHLKKGSGGDVREQGLGSVAIGNYARLILRAEEHPYERDVMTLSTVITNAGEKGPTLTYQIGSSVEDGRRIRWTGTVDLSTDEIAEGRGTQSQRDEWHDADRLLAAAIGWGSVPQKQLAAEADAAGITPAMLRAAKARLHVLSTRSVKGSTAQWEWGPPTKGWPEGLGVPPRPK